MYKINKKLEFKNYLKELPQKEINKLYKKYKEIFSYIEYDTKEELIEESIYSCFRKYIFNSSDKEYKILKEIMTSNETEKINEELLSKNFFFIQDNEIIIPEELILTFNTLDNDENYKRKLMITILFYMEANGVLTVDKLQELITETDLTITKKTLKQYLKEIGIKVINNIAYLNDFAIQFNKSFHLLEQKDILDAGYSIYSLEAIREQKTYLSETNYLIQIYNHFKDKIPLDEERFVFANTIYNYIRCGYNFEYNINAYMDNHHLKGDEYEVKKFNELVEKIYFNIPLWELNGYYQNKELLEEENEIASYINAYIIMNGIMEIENLLDILNNHHHFNLIDEDIPRIIKRLGDLKVKNNYIFLDSLDNNILQTLKKEKSKIKKYKLIDNLDNYFKEFDINQEKINKLIQKYTDNKIIGNQIISLINIDYLNDYTLSTTLRSNKINLEDNKKDRMLKDLNNFKKNYRTWIINGFTPNEIKMFKIK